MRNFMFLGMAVALLTASVAFADGPAGQAGVVTTTDVKGHALHLTISGGIDIDSVWRDDNLVGVLERAGMRRFNGIPPNHDVADGDSFFSPRVWLRFDAYMSDHVSAVIELNNERLRSDLFSSHSDGLGSIPSNVIDAGSGWGAAANADLFGGGYGSNSDIGIGIQQAYIQVDDFLFEHFSMRFGIQDFVVDLRGNGNPFLIGFRPDGAGKAFISPIQEATFNSTGTLYADRLVLGTDSLGVYRGEEEPGGLRFTYSADENLHFDVWTYNIWETGLDHYDEWFYGLMAKYNIPDSPSVIQFLFDVTSNDSDKNRVYTIGPGVDYWWDNLELYGEFYYQWGDYGYTGALTGGGNGNIDQQSFAWYVGGRYNFEGSCNPFVDMQYAYIDGSNGDHNDSGDTNKNFVSYEDNDTLMILEDNLYGLDVQSNYWKAQFQTGLSMCLQHEHDLSCTLTYAYAETVATPNRVNNTSDFTNTSDLRDVHENLGHEVDVKMVWQYSDALSFDLGWAGLFDGEFWTTHLGVNDADSTKINDNMYLISVGATVKF